MRRNPFPKELSRRVTIRVFYPGLKRMEKIHYSPKGQAWTFQGEQNILTQQAGLLETRYPAMEWKMVEVEPHVFNFVETKKEEVA